jgi:hypothetical protein
MILFHARSFGEQYPLQPSRASFIFVTGMTLMRFG